MSPGFLPLILWRIPHADPASQLFKIIMISTVTVLGLSIFVYFRHIARNGNQSDRIGAGVGYAGSVLLTFLLFPAHAELGLTVLVVLAFGDGMATMGGLLLSGPKLPWNRKKTWSGLLCFLAFGIPISATIYWGETHFNPRSLGPPIGWGIGLICGGSATLVASIVESLPSRINDNIRVGVSASITVVIAHGLTVGWS